ncbi:MAG: SPOR domain-containing protein [Nitrospinae bacterium]|nr:SPOR domain-containing protein [Nitrospinota bacterium]
MLEIQEGTHPDQINPSPQAIDEEWKKYNKRLDDLIEDAEIEAEMEAEKKIRSKNTRMVTISMIGVVLLVLVYFQIQNRSRVSPQITAKKPLVEETAFLPQPTPPVPSAEPMAPAKPAPVAASAKPSATAKKIAPRVPESLPPKAVQKPPEAVQKVVRKVIQPVTSENPAGKYSIQLGAFSVKKNAEKFSKRITAKGFQPMITARDTQSIRYRVFLGKFPDESGAAPKLAKLKASGFKSSVKKIGSNRYTIELGLFRKGKDSITLRDKLKARGFEASRERISLAGQTYAVRINGFATEKDAKQTQQKLALNGFKNSFIR